MDVTIIHITAKRDKYLISLVNEFASLQQLKPTTALKRFLLQKLPGAIREERILQGADDSHPLPSSTSAPVLKIE